MNGYGTGELIILIETSLRVVQGVFNCVHTAFESNKQRVTGERSS